MLSTASRRILATSLRHRNHVLKKTAIRALSSSDLPYHIVVGMPALSPTMETGTISEWKFSEGESFSAGDSLAEIETDKATIDFEAQDDGVVAKLLVEAGSADITVGVPIMVTVEEEDDVASFKDFVVEAEAAPAPAAPMEEEVVAVAAVAAEPAPTPVPEPVVAAVPEPVPAQEPVVAAVSEPVEEVVVSSDASSVSVGPSWGNFARVKSPLAAMLSADQKKYIEKYGSTGQIPL